MVCEKIATRRNLRYAFSMYHLSAEWYNRSMMCHPGYCSGNVGFVVH